MNDPLELASYHRPQGWLGRETKYFSTVSSTNDLVKRHAELGVEEGLVVLAEEQTAGRGRGKRRWFAPPGTSLLMSLLFRPREPFGFHALRTTMLVGVALVESVRQVANVPVMLKWPNDLIFESEDDWKKVAGMLSEVGGARPDFLIVGIGLNVNISEKHLLTLAPRAASLRSISGHPVHRATLLDAFLERTEQLYERLYTGWDPYLRWRELLAWMGCAVEVSTPTDVVQGMAVDVAEDGALILQTSEGERRHFPVGDVSLREVAGLTAG